MRVSLADDFFAEIGALEGADTKRVLDGIESFRKNSESPGLRFKPLRGHLKGLWSFRPSKGLRVIVERRGDTCVIITGGHRRDVYDKAERGRLVANPATGYIGFVAPTTTTTSALAARPERPKPIAGAGPKPFDPWSSAELAEVGFGDATIAKLRGLAHEDEFFDLGLEEHEEALAFDIIELTPEQWRDRQAQPGREFEHAAEDEERLVDAVNRFGALAGLSPFLSSEELERLLRAPIEEWMLFLHPDQRALADKEFSGPARVRGSAGTGKTVVVLHRAAQLAERYADDPNPILVTTFIRSLPPVLDHLYRRLPSAGRGRVEFTNIDKLAHRICREAGAPPVIDPRVVESARAKAWGRVNTAGSPLHRLGVTESYAGEEVTAVIKGRGLTDIDSYLATKRTGRRLPLNEAARQQIWAFVGEWNEGLAEKGVSDFADVVLRARDLARARPVPTYRAALIDEAQDLTLAGLQLIRSLVNGPDGDRPDGLFLAGDGAQRIYPGGFNLKQAGVSVRGRTTVFRVNYRNTREVLGVALAATGSEEIEDLDEGFTRQGDAGETLRSGAPPQLIVAPTTGAQEHAVVAMIESLVDEESNGIDSGDIAVLCPTNKLADAMRAAVTASGVAVIDLNRYDGEPTSAVKVGTHHRVKGLEFKAVILTDLSDGVFPRARPAHVTAEQWADQEATITAALFVAMTRARDRLVVSCVGHPSPILEGALDRFELHEVSA